MHETDYARIELLVLDCDGVMTDGRITLTPDGEEIKSFHVRDGSGMKYWQRVGKKVAIISGRGSRAVTCRARELGIDVVRLNAKDKLPVFEEVLAEFDLTAEQTAVIGDDLTDIPLLRRAGFAVAVADAASETREHATYVTELAGGQGCVREVVELILRKAGLWDRIMARYLPAEGGGDG